MKEFFLSTASRYLTVILIAMLSVFVAVVLENSPKYGRVKYVEAVGPMDIVPFPEPMDRDFTHFTSGTGFFVSNHHIVTNEHVVRECRHIRIRGAVKPGYAKLRTTDKNNDLALLVTDRTPKRIAPLRGDAPLKEGEKVTIMGYPLEHGINGDYLMRKAVITDTKDDYNGVDRIQFTDAVSKGNSGGPLLDSNGSVVGVVVGKMSFYLADASTEEEEAEPVKTSSVAVSLDSLKSFLDDHHIYYRSDDAVYDNYKDKWIEEKAKQYVVNIHCVK